MNNLKSFVRLNPGFIGHMCVHPDMSYSLRTLWSVAWQALRSMEFSRLEILELVAISFSIYWCTLKLIEFCTVYLKKKYKIQYGKEYLF